MAGTALPVDIHDRDPGHEVLHHKRLHAVFNESWANICDPDFAGGADPTGGVDATPAEQAAVDAFGLLGGTVHRPAGTYLRTGTVAPPAELTGTLRFTGDEEATVIRPVGTFTLYRPTGNVGQSVCKLIFEKFHIDASGFTGNYCFLRISSNQINIDRIAIRYVTGDGLPVDTGNINNVRWWVLISSNQTAGGQPQNTITDISVEHTNFNGGNAGVEVGSFGAATTSTNMIGDRINIQYAHHNMGTATPTTLAYNGVHVGGYLTVRSVIVAHCELTGGSDAACELNNMQHGLCFDMKVFNSAGYGFYITNFVAMAIEMQQMTWRDCHVVTDDVAVTEFYGFVAAENNSNAMGELVYENISYTRSNGLSLIDNIGEALRVRSRPRSVKVRGFKIDIDTVSHTTASAVSHFAIFIQDPGGTAVFNDVQLRDVQYRITGTKQGGSGTLGCYGLILRLKSGEFDLTGWVFDGHMTNIANSGLVGVVLGDTAGCSMRGSIDGMWFQAWGDDNNAATVSVAVQIAGTSTLTISGKIVIRNVDCQACGATATDLNIHSTQRTKVTVDNPSCKRRANLPNQFSVTTFHDGTSGYAGGFLEWQNGGSVEAAQHFYGPWDGYFCIKGGTVTQILVKNAIADSYFDIGVTQGRIPLNNGETIKVVGSGALPSMIFQPRV